ncbi:hypothetical protein CROQUDRAFT_14811, partial [Cronartium quercuum f. sp. fusiforme G11]
LKTHIEKFNALLQDYYRFQGDTTSTQAARTLIGSLKPGYEVTIDVIYRIIKPLTYEKVKQELIDTDEGKTFTTPAMTQANYSYTSNAHAVCVGNTYQRPHAPKDCFKKPENHEKQAEWMAK